MPKPRSTFEWPAISAHRGGLENATANTWDAFTDAIDSGVEYVEFDVRLTREGTWVVFHDAHVGMVAVRELSHERLCELAGYPVPAAVDVMGLLAAGGVVGHLDLKESTGERSIIGPAVELFGVDGFVATTESAASIARIGGFAPGVRTALSCGHPVTGGSLPRFDVRSVVDCGARWVALDHRLATDRVLESCRRTGVSVLLWTVNDSDLIAHYLGDPRVDVLVTDRPRYASTVRREISIHRAINHIESSRMVASTAVG